MGFVFIIIVIAMIGLTIADASSKDTNKGLEIDTSMFKVSNGFAVGALLVLGILLALYTSFW